DRLHVLRGHEVASGQDGPCPRGSLALVKLGRARAVLAGRDFVTPEDVKAVAVPALGHRLALRPGSWGAGAAGGGIVRDLLNSVPAPAPEVPAPGPEVPAPPPEPEGAR